MPMSVICSVMKQGLISIAGGRVVVTPAAGMDGRSAVWMSKHQIADLFGVFVAAVGANIRSTLKSEVLDERRVVRQRTHKDGSSTTLYNLEMITALAFRLKSRQAELFRQWIVRQAVSPIVYWEIPHMETLPN